MLDSKKRKRKKKGGRKRDVNYTNCKYVIEKAKIENLIQTVHLLTSTQMTIKKCLKKIYQIENCFCFQKNILWN